MSDFYVKPGDSVSFAKTVSESDVYLFAGITGDFAVNHVNEQYMARSKYGTRIAHGALLIGFASTCSSMMIEKCNGTGRRRDAGLARLRQGALPGPRLHRRHAHPHLHHRRGRSAKRRSTSDIKVVNQKGDLVGVARHILAWVKDKG